MGWVEAQALLILFRTVLEINYLIISCRVGPKYSTPPPPSPRLNGGPHEKKLIQIINKNHINIITQNIITHNSTPSTLIFSTSVFFTSFALSTSAFSMFCWRHRHWKNTRLMWCVWWVVSASLAHMPSTLPTHLQTQRNFDEVDNKQQLLSTQCKKHNTNQLQVSFIFEPCYWNLNNTIKNTIC